MPRPAMRTFLFSDLRDYTLFIETKGDAGATRMLRASRKLVRAAVAEHRGAEIKTEGDSFYVVFRSPSSAVRCALEIQRAAAEHTRRHPDVPVRMGIGINTGEAVPHDKGYVGSAVILASRLSVTARAGQTLVTDTVRALVRTGAHASMRELGAWTLKGVAEPVRVYELEATASAARALGPALALPAMLVAPPRSAPGLVVCPDLVQRDAPLEALVHHLDAATRGEAHIVALSGEAGIGKSRLVRELAAIAHRDGMYVFGGRSHPAGPPYEPIVAALRPYAHARGTEILRRLLGALVGELRRLLPELALAHGEPDPNVPSAERRDRFLRTIDLLLEDAASQRPVLLVLEDFHDADDASREFLRYLASSFRSGICVVLTYREEEVGPAHPLRALLSELDREGHLARVVLSPLDLGGVERMTAALVAGRDTGALARSVFERSEGIPFYVEELLKTALDDGGAGRATLALPRTIADSVRLRVGRLVASRGPAIADLLEAAAIAEVPLGYEVLLRLSEREETDAGADVEAAIEAQLLERPPTHADLYHYRHALTREAVVADISPARARRLHARVAQAIEAEAAPASRAALLSRHFAAAGDRSKALAYARQGAANAIRVGAYSSAIDLLRDAVAMASGTADEGTVLEELADAFQAAGRASEADDALTRARGMTVDPSARARIDVRLASVLRMRGQRADALAAVRRAILTLADDPGPALAQALIAEAEIAWAESDLTETVRLSTSGLEVARRSGTPATEVEALALLGAASTRLGHQNGISHIQQAIRSSHDRGLGREEVNAYHELARALLWRGRNDEGLAAARTGIDLARERGLEFLQARLLSVATTIAVNLGRYPEARAFAEQAVALARPDTVAAANAKMALAHVVSDQGEGEQALALYEQIRGEIERNEPERQLIYWSYHAQALLGLGRLDQAAASARRAVDLTLSFPGQGMTAFLNAAEIAEARRDREGIADLAAKFERAFAGRDTPPTHIARLEIAAIRELCEGRDAALRFAELADLYESLGARVRATYRRATVASLRLADPRHRASARRDLLARRRDLVSYGAFRYVNAVDAALKRRRAAPFAASSLLRGDELRVAVLVSRGLTDERIARELKVPVDGAASLVRSVLARLGVASRSQIASWVISRPGREPEVVRAN